MKNHMLMIPKQTILLIVLWLAGSAQAAQAANDDVAQSPLFLMRPVKPNIMLMLDNSGSMSNIVPESPYDPSQNYINCPLDRQITPCTGQGCIQINISGGKPYIYYYGDVYTLWKNNAGDKCFKPDGTYSALLAADNATNTAPSGLNGDADYSGNYLNWYFDASNTGSWTGKQKPGTFTRMEIAQKSATNLVDSLKYVRLGLSAYYNSDDGGALLETIEDIDEVAGKQDAVKNKIAGLKPENNTPLAETLSDIGRYFTTGYTGDLTLHPDDASKAKASIGTIFTQGSVADHKLYNSSGKDDRVSPIQYSCQKSFAVLMTDGLPNLDRDVSSSLRDYTGDCAKGKCISTPTNPYIQLLPGGPLTTINYANGTQIGRSYEWGGSDYLDDVAQALFEMDLRPDLTKTKVGEKNNLITYTIGFADPSLQNGGILDATAKLGGGQNIIAKDSTELADAFHKIITDINNQVLEASASSLAANSTRLSATTRIYQAGFNSTDWTGSLKSFALTTESEDKNNNGILDTGEDSNSNGVLDLPGALITPEKWAAENLMPAAASRRILSYNPLAATASKGITFDWDSLNSAQKLALDASAAASSTSTVVDYIRGVTANEQPTGAYRKRNSILGDIVNSDPLVVNNTDDFGYSLLPDPEGAGYASFRKTKSSRANVIYIGANDGMLHAFNADTGVELFAYVPNAVIPGLKTLTDPNYGCKRSGCLPHEYFVDGSPTTSDAYFAVGSASAAWHTVLLGTTGAGAGKAVFALDITTPSASMGTDKVLWEISPTQAPVTSDLADNVSISPTKLGFANNLGYSIPQPSLVRMQNGSWAVIVANGYNSVNQKAVLFILDAATGAIIRTIDTGKGSSTQPNGLSTPIPVDVDGDRVVDYIYAGDLLGNLWKFDVTDDSDTSKWAVAFGTSTSPAPLFTACSGTCSGSNFQPITAKPQVGRHPNGGVMVYFGTGKYYESGDQIVGSTPQVQSFYGIRDQNSVVAGRTRLQEQKILAEAKFDNNGDSISDIALRATSDTTVDYVGNASANPPVTPKQGWYMDLLTPIDIKKGERVISQAKLRDGRVNFFTMSPSTDPCAAGGTSWFLGLDAVNGKSSADPVFDADKNGQINVSDKKLMDINHDGRIDSSDYAVSISGIQQLNSQGGEGGITKNQVVLMDNEKAYDIGQDSKKEVDTTQEIIKNSLGRQSWHQIH